MCTQFVFGLAVLGAYEWKFDKGMPAGQMCDQRSSSKKENFRLLLQLKLLLSIVWRNLFVNLETFRQSNKATNFWFLC